MGLSFVFPSLPDATFLPLAGIIRAEGRGGGDWVSHASLSLGRPLRPAGRRRMPLCTIGSPLPPCIPPTGQIERIEEDIVLIMLSLGRHSGSFITTPRPPIADLSGFSLDSPPPARPASCARNQKWPLGPFTTLLRKEERWGERTQNWATGSGIDLRKIY